MKTILPALRLASLCLMATCSLRAYDALTRPTELQYWDSTRAQDGYTFFGVGGNSYLLDMSGRVVHSWPVGNNPHLQDDGSILDASTDDPSGFGGFKIVSWDGVTTWSYTESRSTYHPHHDFTRVFNKKLNAYTVLYIANKDFTQAELIAAGANPATTPSTGGQMDALVEVDSTGTVVWEWCFFDHLVQDYDATKANHVGTGKTIASFPNKLNINLSGHSLKSDWLHCNSVDYNPTLDQIVVNSVQGEFYVIDHGNTFVLGDPTASKAKAATTAGDFLYRFGDPARYNQGGLSGNAAPTVSGSVPAVLEDWTQSTTGTKQMGGAHDIQWIPEGLPGAGNFLIFNNAEYLSEHTSQSYVFEINPYLDAGGTTTGSYVNPPEAGYNSVAPLAVTDKSTKLISKQVVWNYSSRSNLTVFSQIGCSAQRLPNGNTLVCADTEGYIQEVTPAGDCVWDYIVPVTPSGTVQTIGDRLPMINSIFRAYRYTASHPALVGRTLTGTTTIAGRTTVANPYAGTSNYQAMQRETETQYWDQANAANGYTFFGTQGTSYLIDMAGRKVHTWPTGTDARLLDSGNVLDWATDSSGNTGLKELDWSGNTVWQYYETRSIYHPHGDFKRIYDPKLGAYATLYLTNKDVTSAECLAAGCDPADAPFVGAQIETIVEVDMSGNIVWEWSFWDHAIQNIDNSKANYGATIASYPGKIDLNLPGRPLQSNWLDCNSLDFNQSLNQIIVNSRQGEFYIIDHGNTFLAGNPSGSTALAATSAGDFLYRFGDPARYGQGTAPSVSLNWENATSGNKQIGASSNAQWIPSGLSGAGHLMVFSNNQYLYQRTPQSYVFEINPFLNSSGTDTGSYVNPPAAGYTTWTFSKDTMKANQSLSSQVTWKYGTVGCHTLFSHFGSSVQRLTNGNTLICATTTGYLVEVDASGNVVWEYINPVTASGVVTAIGDCLPMTNALPRAMRFPASFSGFTGHDLTPVTTIAGRTVVVDELPSLKNTARTPLAPTASDAVWITSTITDDGSVASANLTYTAATGTPTTTTPFTESFGTTAVKPWTSTSTGTDNAWTIAATTNPFELRTGANYVTSTTACGVECKCSAASTGSSITTTNTINTTGSSGYVEFYVGTLTLGATDSWALQLDATGTGNSFVTRLSETGSSHAMTKFHYDLDSSERVSTLKMRFLFTGAAASTGRIDLDQIVVTVTTGSSSTVTLAMLDDGAHGDGTAGDHVYGAQIPAQALGTTVSYYLAATDNSGQIAKDPAAAPATTYSYTVAAAPSNTAPTVAVAASATPSPATGTTTALTALGADADTGESTLTYTWAATTLPSGASAPNFSVNGSNAAKSTTATFGKAGSYDFTVTIADPGGLSVTSSVSVTVTNTSHLVTMAALPDTGQVASYSTIFGEDSDYNINPPTYKDNGDGTVTDIVTGLMWQKADGGEMTWEQAVAYATTLSLGGHSDWRLAFAKELYSITDQGTINPAINATYFTTSAAEYWWSSDVAVDDATKVWAANAGGGIGPHPKTETLSAGGTKRFHVRCVREPVASGASHLYANLTDNGDGTVTDNNTGLVWQQAESATMTWENALVYAENLSLGGHSDWRLPNIKELQSVSDGDLRAPSLDKSYFTDATTTFYWSSTSLSNDTTQAWYLDSDYGLTSYTAKTGLWHVRCVRGGTATSLTAPALRPIPAGSFVMGDHFNFSDPDHPSDELPLHTVAISAFSMGTYDITNRQYCTYLNSALVQGLIEVRNGLVYATGGTTIYCETRQGESALFGLIYSGIEWDGTSFSVLANRDNHPMVGVRWEGAAAYCNWLSTVQGYQSCYNLTTWVCDFTKNGYRLPTEAEWEYAANGGRTAPYYQFPWGSNTNTDGTWSNWENSGDPFETGDYPGTTPVGFYDGTLHAKSDFNWPGSQTTYQTSNAVNGFGLYDMGGNVWQWVNDWYANGYYSISPSSNPTGPATGDAMPDGNAYRGMRGGTWYNGALYLGLSRISNRDPGYYRGPQDPNHPYYHVGFRVALKSSSLVQAGATTTPVVSSLQFGEGPAADASGNVFFSDITANTIYKWSVAGTLSVFRTDSGGANGLAFDSSGNLIACEGTNGRVVSISPLGVVTVLASQYNGIRFNEPNDLWIDSKGGIYFTDPVFFGSQVQDTQAVYYISADRSGVTRVISDMVKPNGLVGSADGTTLYVSDYGAGNTYKYTINSDGSLTGKTLFVAVGSDGMETDSSGNIYLTTSDVLVYSSAGILLQTINVPNRPTNLCFAGADRRTLFITTESSMYSIMVVPQGLATTFVNAAPSISLTTCTPTTPTDSDVVWIASRITDDTSVASATLTYSTGSDSSTTTVFTETMASTASKPWTGSGTVNAWSVTGSNYIEQRTGANYGTGNACGMEYKAGVTANALTDAMVANTTTINAVGASAYVEFWVQTLTLTGTAGWTFQIDPTGTGNSYVTRLSELSGSSHTWQKYHYDLTSGELVGTLKMRFQFTGGGTGTDHRIDLDQISMVVTSASGGTSSTVTMLDDGLHGDGAAGDGIYGGQIPAKPVGTTVSYYLSATDGDGLTTTAPSGAPTNKLSYTVASGSHAPTVATAAAATPGTVTGTTTSLTALGADVDTAESTLTYTWAATTLPSGATAPAFSANGSNAAKSTTATFSKAGTYGFTVTIADPGGLTVTSTVNVTVNQTLITIAVSPATTTLAVAATQQFSAVASDQFGSALATPPTFTWATTVTGGTIGASGLFTAPATATNGNVTATSGAVSGSAAVTCVQAGQSMGLFLNTDQAYNGYTLMAPMHYKKTYLINNAGEVVHRWSSAYEPGRAAYLMENGHMIRACMIMSGGPSTGGGEGGRIEEYDWDGNMVWAFDYYSSNYIAHHDFKVLPNGNVLVLVAEKKTYAEVIAAGFDPALLDSSISTSGYMLPDCLIEVTPTKPYGGTVVWEWHIWDHTIQDFSSSKSNYGVVTNHPELIDVNGPGIKIPQFWNHVNGIDYNADLDQVMLSIRGNSEVFVIDHQTTTAQAASHAGGRYGKGGDILYRWGNPQQYNRGTNANQQLFQQHHTHWIPNGCPGAGNILIFNNGIGRGYSTVNEIVPPVDAAGNYSLTTGAAYGPSAPVWTYKGSPATDFYSAEISGCQRLPNGNTLICEGVKGNLFEVTASGACVWQYLCPVTDAGPLTQGGSIAVDSVRTDQYMNAVFRVYRYGADYAGLVGRDLTANGSIELPFDTTLRMTASTVTKTASSSTATMSWVSLPDKTYTVQYSPTLLDGSWTTIATIPSIGTLTRFTDTDATRLSLPKGFYRVALTP
ncbi:MAG: DUF1566 domain-containing protein [Verrucomicrobiota bacterium]